MQRKAELMLFVVTLLWAGTFAMIKPALNHISPMLFVTIRFFVASAILFIFIRNSIKVIPRDSMIKGINLGIFLYIGFAVQTIGLQYTTATKSALITGTFIIFTPIFQTVIEKRIPKTGSIIGVCLALVGMLLLSSGENDILMVFKMLGSDFNFGDFLTLICAIFYAIYIVYLDIISPSTKFIHIVWLQIIVTMILSALTVGILHFSGIESVKYENNSRVILTILYTAIFATLLTTFLQTKYQGFTSPTRAALIFTSEPLLASIIAYIFLSERMSAFGIAGGIFIIAGVLFSEFFDMPKKLIKLTSYKRDKK